MAMAATAASRLAEADRAMTSEERLVIFASSLGTVFEWYDFYLYGSLATIIGAQFFGAYDENTRNIFALLAFAAGFLVRPFGALVFGRIGDLVGRKYTFLVTILIMGLSTFIVGLLPGSADIGILAPIILISLRLLQGLALGGEYGGAATYVAEHAPAGRRGFYTSWIQTTATLGLFLSLLVILATRTYTGEVDFAKWGWRIPFLVSVALLGVSLWIRLQLNESPAFTKMKEEGTTSKAPLTESFGNWPNAKIALIALLGLTAGQGVVWYTGQFYALFFLQTSLKVGGYTANLLVAYSLLFGTLFFVFFGWLSDKIGRKPIILAGCLIAALSFIPIFKQIAATANPALANAVETVKVTVVADPANCGSLFDPFAIAKFTTSCDIARKAVAGNSARYTVEAAPAGQMASVKVGTVTVDSYDMNKVRAEAADAEPDAAKKAAAGGAAVTAAAGKLGKELLAALNAAGYPKADDAGIVKMTSPLDVMRPQVYTLVGWLFVLIIFVTMVYGPIAAALVELFPTRIRYTSMSLPYHIGNGWFGDHAIVMASFLLKFFFGLRFFLLYPKMEFEDFELERMNKLI